MELRPVSFAEGLSSIGETLAGKMAGEVTVVHGLSREFETLAGIPTIRSEAWDFDGKLTRLLDDDGGFREVAGKTNEVGMFQQYLYRQWLALILH